MKRVIIYTDGGYRHASRIGSWAFTAKCMDFTYEKFGTKRDTTNNVMELEAACEALELLQESCLVTIYSDSAYVVNGYSKWMRGWVKNGWRNSKGEAVANMQVWLRLQTASKKFDHKLRFRHVRAHRGNVGNERADSLCNLAMDEAIKK